ncbi:DUF302 domain-containing protein [Labilibacter marinus]|uniref:DUF302 domain-containing protein n=1 Tax=Labilibacter marinus TaxID=1477105 RepID=UPI0009F984AF|nr:DUF302 domain-containing protein [Labilibacter marinus]
MKTTALLFVFMMFTTLAGAQEKYYFSKTFDLSFEEATTKVKASLKEQGFGIVAESNMDKMLKEKIGADLLPYRVLGACNPKIAHKALLAEENIAIFLPCKVIIKFITETKTEIVVVNPAVAMQAVKNKKAQELFKEVSVLMKKALDGV